MSLNVRSLQRHVVANLCHDGTVAILRHAAPDLSAAEFETAYTTIFDIFRQVLLRLIAIERECRPTSPLPSAN